MKRNSIWGARREWVAVLAAAALITQLVPATSFATNKSAIKPPAKSLQQQKHLKPTVSKNRAARTC